MTYLTLIPDYTDKCLRDDSGSSIEIGKLNLPQHFIDRLNYWHTSYREIIPLNDEERLKFAGKIEELDNLGLSLANELQNLIRGGAKVKYFSEGKLKFLLVD